ncbi:MAG: triphosphoribosyl-dephospho-CoA synthase [Haloarculaceae archaeon]
MNRPTGEADPPARAVADDAQLALLLEVTGTPKPGNVDRDHDYPDLRFEHFVAGAVRAGPGLEALASGGPLGDGFELAVAGMSGQSGGNTQFGALLALSPLLGAVAADHRDPDGAGTTDRLDPADVEATVAETTVDDAVAFYRAFDHVDVAVGDPPPDVEAPDVRLGGDAESRLRTRDMALADVMAESAEVDGVAAEWTGGFPRTFDAADGLLDRSGPIADRVASVYLDLLAEEVDTFVLGQHGRETAEEVRDRAAAARVGAVDPAALADEFVQREINPGTTADLTTAAVFVALQNGLEV